MSNITERRRTKRVSYVDDSDASGSVEERSPVSKKRKRAAGKKKETIDAYFGGQNASEEPMHPLSRHSISNPKPLRQALLKWFDGVHDIAENGLSLPDYRGALVAKPVLLALEQQVHQGLTYIRPDWRWSAL